jgi:hypothetical protein
VAAILPADCLPPNSSHLDHCFVDVQAYSLAK